MKTLDPLAFVLATTFLPAALATCAVWSLYLHTVPTAPAAGRTGLRR